MNTCFKPLLAALLIAGSCAAQAAHVELVDHLAAGGYSGLLGTDAFSDDAADLSSGSDVALLGARSFSTAGTSYGYVADGYFLGSSQSLSMSLTQYITAPAGNSYAGTAFVSIPGITLLIAGDGSEAIGSQVLVSFSGLACAFNSYAPGTGTLDMDVSVMSGNNTLGSWQWDASSAGVTDVPLSFSFNATVGQQLTLSGFMLGNLGSDGTQAIDASAGGALSGSFSITPVPEASSYAMLLAGLGLMAIAARRRV